MAEWRKFALSTDEPNGIVWVTYQGVISLDDRKQAVDAAVKVMEEAGIKNVLVDFRNAEMDINTPEQDSAFADYLSRNPVLIQGRTAYLSRPGQAVNWFIEILARARRYDCNHFNNPEDALAWLKQGS